ncbi:class I SAM-dependent methyltransferase [Mycolicibacter longobardus]|uniref:Ubiquinone biosynthesis protein n=1 Tax=Mycolicibacter longobardus TaxID=1108812 RepID=A0A1X1Y801_9MYCO|nr:class I SAM-dependent methyltransferase [Mycolicibacter longobardus]MCV7384658.1 class I SAM-dependent methyltransferase [Mycolicibacter longobardus]ORW07252.1 ubiquinone biosynthesis protein [Mycolicibacter longobardus]
MNVSQLWQNKLFARTVGASYARAIEQRGAARVFGRILFGTDVDRIYRAMRVVAELPEGSAVLDVPCGGGITIAQLTPGQRVRYVAMDISAGMLDHARRRLRPDQHDTVEFVEASIEQIPFPDDEFDLCVCFNGLHCLPDPAAAIREIARCLKPGGRLVGDFATRGQVRRADAYMVLMRTSGTFGPGGTLNDARRWFTEAGLTIDELECSGAITHFAVHK